MKFIGFNYDERKKTYFTDRHESMENRKYRKEYIKQYFSFELYTYRWVQITDECGDALERDENVKLLKNIYHSFERDNIKMREYHVDSHISVLDQRQEIFQSAPILPFDHSS